MMKYTEVSIAALYDASLSEACDRLASLSIAEGRRPSMNGLNGWIFEQTVCHCLFQELKLVGLNPPMKEQVQLSGRAKVDLLVGNAAIELKVGGSFGSGDEKYGGYREIAEKRGWAYLYLAKQETYFKYRQSTEDIFGVDRAFFLDTPGDWSRFVKAVVANCNSQPMLP